MIDEDNSGTITFEELKDSLKSVGCDLMESEIKSLMEAVGRLSLSLIVIQTKVFNVISNTNFILPLVLFISSKLQCKYTITCFL